MSIRRRRRTKIIATIGPASANPEMLERLFRAGADVFRLNFSHGSHDDHDRSFAMIRDLEKKIGRSIGVLADVQGPKLRVGRFSNGRVQLQTGQSFRLDLSPTPGDSTRVQLPHPEILAAAGIGTNLLLDDGKLRLRVQHVRPDHLITEIVTGGMLSDRKGVNVPDMVLPIPALTVKDREDLAFALEHGADFIGLSFVQRPEDVAEAREIAAGRAWIMSKIEKPQALDRLDDILALSDAVMVARGLRRFRQAWPGYRGSRRRAVRPAWHHQCVAGGAGEVADKLGQLDGDTKNGAAFNRHLARHISVVRHLRGAGGIRRGVAPARLCS
jgi:pyruvate kinase